MDIFAALLWPIMLVMVICAAGYSTIKDRHETGG